MLSPLFATVGLLAILAGGLCWHIYAKHNRGLNAPEQTVNVTILDKQSIDVEIAHQQVGQDTQEYWIYVQKGHFGPKREFQVAMHYYQALTPGDKGALTYRGDQFVHFALQR
ncbi:DUF2500 domain-containing protein [Vibrio astriarenae]|jgi:hypothetical protein|uniref:DUF2500 domain-containing protein n=1 Tax=Vibrio agarivorans TaxID=153622 RepID=UPI00222E96AF|nr:DUF2500 domain-containing protein [Vibrio agarivorans]